jgi:uncharacterized protein (DUF433 family)
VNHSSVDHIEKTMGICGGKSRIAGHSIRVMDIVVWHEMRGYSPDEIVDMFPGISLADVHSALAYYFDNRTEIEKDLRGDAEIEQIMKMRFPSKVRSQLDV